jgi:hypothetical protein
MPALSPPLRHLRIGAPCNPTVHSREALAKEEERLAALKAAALAASQATAKV